ncbi:MAG: YlbF family regulator [Bacilli bacterium]
METNLYFALMKLKDSIRNSDEYKSMLDLDKKLNQNEEVMKLAYLKDLKIMDYEDNLKHYSKNSKEVLTSQKEIKVIMDKINEVEIVKQYNKSYNEINDIYLYINKELFSFFGDKKC